MIYKKSNILLYKKGGKSECGNYRGIRTIPVGSNIPKKMILSRIR